MKNMCFRKIISLIIVFAMVMPWVEIKADSSNEKPTDLTPIYVDDFSDGIISPHIAKRKFYTSDPADTLIESDGKLTFKRTKYVWYSDATAGEPTVRLHANENQTGGADGKVFTEFTLSKTREVVRVRINDDSFKYITEIKWEGDRLSYTWRDADMKLCSASIDAPASESVRISLSADIFSNTPKFSLWLNDELKVDNGFSTQDLSSAHLAMVQVYTLIYGNYSKNEGTFTIEDFGIYRVNESDPEEPEPDNDDEQKVDSDLNFLTEDLILSLPKMGDYLIDSLKLDALGHGHSGSEITWRSSDEDIISPLGTVTRPDEDTKVTITATVTSGECSKEKEFTFTVPGKDTDVNGLPGNLTPIYTDGFSDGEISPNTEKGKFYTGNPADTLTEHDGNLVFERQKYVWYTDADAGEPRVRLHANEDKSGYSGKVYTEFTVSKTCDVLRIRLNATDGQYISMIQWEGDKFKISYCDSSLASKSETLTISSGDTVKVGFYADTASNRPMFSMWINNEKIIDRKFSCTQLNSDSVNFGYLQFYTLIYGNYGKSGKYSLDNVGIYSVDSEYVDKPLPKPPVEDNRTDEEKVTDDLDAITDNDVLSVPQTEDGYIIDHLDIDGIKEGEGGSRICWASSNEDIIAIDGKLTRPIDDTEVTVTATATLGDVIKSKSFTYKVAGMSTDVGGMRTDRFPLYYDDFSDGVISPNITKRNLKSTDIALEENGKLILRSEAQATHEPGFMIYQNDTQSVLSGDFITEFTLSKTCDVVRMRMYNANWNYLSQIYWNKSSFSIEYKDSENKTKNLNLTIDSDSKAKVTIYTNITGSQPSFTMWVNNKLVLEDVTSCMNMSPGNVKWTSIYTANYSTYTKVGDVMIDNFGYYDILAKMSDKERVKADADIIDDAALIKTTTPLEGYAYEDLNFPSYGKNGSRIIWSTSDESIISSDGTVTRPSDKNVEVTITAEFISGNESLTKTYKIIVIGNHVVTDDVPTVETMIVENDFSSPDTPSHIDTNIVGSGTAQVENGALVISKTDSGTAQVGAMIYTGLDKTNVATGVIGLEFDVTRQSSKPVQIRTMDANGNLYYSMAWGGSGISAYYSDDKSVQGTQNGVWSGSGNTIHINLMFDTANSTYWLWVNGKPAIVEKYSRSVGVSAVCYTMFYLENIETIKIDNYKVYHAIPPQAQRLKFDFGGFGEKDILNETPIAGNIIQSDLTLPTELRYKTTITWESSHPDIIDPQTGKVTRPLDTDDNPLVIITANMENSGVSASKEFSYRVLRDFSDGTDIGKMEAEDIKPYYITNENPNAIRQSLNLMEKGLYGSPIMWSSSDTSVITNSGRVIRPRFDEEDVTVTMTAKIGDYTKDLTFTVLKDEAPKDPMHTSDEEFFGLWESGSFVKGPQLDYSIPGLSAVMEAAKSGDYERAKEELLEYFKTRDVPSPISLGTRRTGWVDARADGLLELGEEASYWKGQMTITSDDYEAVTASIHSPSSISKIKCKTFELIARYNESTSAFVLGTDADNPNKVPKLELTVNGAVRTYIATGSATIRAGSYSREHIDNNKELQAKMFGDFLGDETYRILLSFDLSDIEASDKIEAAQLVIYAKKSVPYADNKQLWIIDNRGKAWDEETVFWDNLNFTVHNYNGLVGGSNWKGAKSSDIEFAYQAPRFMHSRNTMTEYKYTGNEKYAYSLLGQVMDIIVDTGNQTPYPRSLDAGLRMHQWVPLMNTFKDSPYMTSEFVTAFMKYMYRQFKYFPSRKDATGNWREYEQLAVLYATSAYPELTNSASTKATCIESWQNAFNKSFMSDGSYIEDTGGYHRSSFAMYRDFKKACIDSNTMLPEEFDETLRKAAYYMVLTNSAEGYPLQYGDESGGGASASSRYAEVADWYNDYEFRFIDSFGKVGTEPAWTSYQFPEGRYTMMRSNWDKDAIYLHTNVRGGGGHGHADDNSIILFGNGKRLLVDAGKFTYNTYDPARIYGLSTKGHNTVVINDQSQRMGWTGNELTVRGNINSWVTNSEFDFLSQSTISYADQDHTRSILFIKDGLFVVSDLMKPKDASSENNYKQYWHMLPDANISADDDKNVLKSNYDDGKNLILASADDDRTFLEEGYYDTSDGTPVANNAGIFEKTVMGDASFDTVMYVSKYKDASVSAERIESDFSENEVSAVKINVYENSKSETYYYMQNYSFEENKTVSFADFTTDAKVALIGTDKDGNIISAIMSDGSYIKENGKTILETKDSVTDIFAEFKTSKLSIVSSDTTLSSQDIKTTGKSSIKSAVFNGEGKEFKFSNGVISLGKKDAEEIIIDDKNKNDGIKDKPSSGSGGGGNSGDGGFVPPPLIDSTIPFSDISGHWAKDYIVTLHSKNIINGNPDGTYSPDNSITRAEFVAIAIRTLGEAKADYTNVFDDVSSSDWFAKDVQTAVNLGIISADVKFRPNDNITREEMAKILTGCAHHLGMWETKTTELGFSDSNLISDWAKEYVEFAFSNGLVNGKDSNMFDPKGNTTRAETAAVFCRLISK
ncbi:MAG: S-layer homology domain-containing protein [Clostridia bacterium]|nr:S-layer homology domain-containing protein [Clostridia bacterium]